MRLEEHGALFLILLWNFMMGVVQECVNNMLSIFILNQEPSILFSQVVLLVPGGIIVLSLLQILYPFGGILADLYCGRYRVIAASLLILCFGYVMIFLLGLSYITTTTTTTTVHGKEIYIAVTGVITLLVLVVGSSGLQANSVQFGLDQLLEASSQKLSKFLHWFVWTEICGGAIINVLSAISFYNTPHKTKEIIYTVGPLAVLLVMIFTLLLFFWKGHWFYQEPKVRSPYGTMYRVLKFARKHSKPIRRSALTFADDVRPTRIEFAKEKYGGPFTTEEVEDVKTFVRILVMLLVTGSVFFLVVCTDYLVAIFGIHLGLNAPPVRSDDYSYQWILLQSASLAKIIPVVIIPLYMLMYSKIVRWLPRILFRLGIGVFLTVSVVLCLFVIQVWANIRVAQQNVLDPPCMFLAEYRNFTGLNFSQTLEFPTESLILPHVLKGIATPLLYVTALEFISAQSPHQMKGLLLGLFYASKGLFMILGSALTFPFTSAAAGVWKDTFEMFDCGFYYYLMNVVVGFVCFVLFLCGAKWYKYRVREEEPYGPRYVEDVYDRYTRYNILEPEVNMGRYGATK